jgi:hypothetical protein
MNGYKGTRGHQEESEELAKTKMKGCVKAEQKEAFVHQPL